MPYYTGNIYYVLCGTLYNTMCYITIHYIRLYMILEYNILLIEYKYTMLGYSIARIRYTNPSQRANLRYYLKVSDIKRKVVIMF